MQENQVNIQGETHPLEKPFFVMATQNPIESADLMGFSMNHETETMYFSGHPKSGANLGFRMSTDNGNSWTTVSKVKKHTS